MKKEQKELNPINISILLEIKVEKSQSRKSLVKLVFQTELPDKSYYSKDIWCPAGNLLPEWLWDNEKEN